MIADLFVPVVTPFAQDGTIDDAALAAHCEWVISQGASGVMLFGTTGEGPSISVREKIDSAAALLRAVPGIPVIGSVTEASVVSALECVRGYSRLALEAILVLPPYYFAERETDGIERFLDETLDASGHPVIAYHIPSLAPGVPAAYVGGSRLWGAKDSGGDIGYTKEIIKSGKAVMVGAESLVADAVVAGAAGAIAGMGNLLPAQLARICALAKEGDLAEAHRLRDDVVRLQQAVVQAAPEMEFIAAFKDIAALFHGHQLGDPRLPLRRRRNYLTDAVLAVVEEIAMPGAGLTGRAR